MYSGTQQWAFMYIHYMHLDMKKENTLISCVAGLNLALLCIETGNILKNFKKKWRYVTWPERTCLCAALINLPSWQMRLKFKQSKALSLKQSWRRQTLRNCSLHCAFFRRDPTGRILSVKSLIGGQDPKHQGYNLGCVSPKHWSLWDLNIWDDCNGIWRSVLHPRAVISNSAYQKHQ